MYLIVEKHAESFFVSKYFRNFAASKVILLIYMRGVYHESGASRSLFQIVKHTKRYTSARVKMMPHPHISQSSLHSLPILPAVPPTSPGSMYHFLAIFMQSKNLVLSTNAKDEIYYLEGNRNVLTGTVPTSK